MTGEVLAIAMASVVVVMLLGGSIWRVFWPRPSRGVQSLLFSFAVGLSLLVLRWPSISWPCEINEDESQMLAQGMRFLAHPVPWRDVDGTTSGPLNSLALSLPLSLGAPASWQTARIVMVALECLTLLFLYLTFRLFGTRSEAQFSLMPTFLFYAFALRRDFTHYSSEALSILLLSAAIFLLSREWKAVRPSKTRWFLLGLLLGSVPFAKLQASPLALFFAIIGFALLCVRHRRAEAPRAVGWRETLAFCLGGLTLPALILGVVIAHGVFADFWKSYILASGAYVSQESWLLKAAHLRLMLFMKSDFRSYLFSAMGAMILLLAAWRSRTVKLTGEILWPLLVIMAGGVVTLLCLFAAGKAFNHYMLLLVPTFGALFGLVYFAGKVWLAGEDGPAQKPSSAFIGWLAAFSLLAIGFQSYKSALYVRDVRFYTEEIPPMSLVGQSVRTIERPDDTMAIWGWAPVYFVETGIMPANRDAIGHYVISAGRYQRYFRKRYLDDLMKSKPSFFVDAVSNDNFLWTWTTADTHESFPALAQFIHDNYTLWRSISANGRQTPVRVYVLNQRLAGLHLASTDLPAARDPAYATP